MKPDSKLLVGGAAGAIVTIIVWALDTFAHITVPAEVATAGVVIISFTAGYLAPRRETTTSDTRPLGRHRANE